MPDLENAMLVETEALLDPEFVPEGWLDPPTPPKKKLKLSHAKKKTESTSQRPAKQVSVPCAGPTSSSSGTGVS